MNSANKMRVEALTTESCAPFGKVISFRGREEGSEDFTWYGEVGAMQNERIQLNLCTMKVHIPILREMEFHRETKEALVVLDGAGIVLVMATGEMFEKGELRALFVGRGEGIIFNEGILHSTPFAVDETAKMLIVFQTDTGANDLILRALDAPVMIDIEDIRR